MIGPELQFVPRGLYIGGEWQEATEGGRLESINPSTGERLGEVPFATETDVDRAVRAGRKAFESEWSRIPIRERAGCLERLADRLHQHRDELGLMDCVDSGNALAGMIGDVAHGRDGWHLAENDRLHALFEGYVGHAAALAATLETDVGDVVLDVDQRYMSAVTGNGGIDLFIQNLEYRLSFGRFQPRFG